MHNNSLYLLSIKNNKRKLFLTEIGIDKLTVYYNKSELFFNFANYAKQKDII